MCQNWWAERAVMPSNIKGTRKEQEKVAKLPKLDLDFFEHSPTDSLVVCVSGYAAALSDVSVNIQQVIP